MRSHSIDLALKVQQERAARLCAVREHIDELLAWITGAGVAMQVHGVEKRLFASLMKLGCLLVSLWFWHTLPRKVPAGLRYRRGFYALVGNGLSRAALRTRFGEVTEPRPVYRLASGRGPRLVSPHDRRIGLAAGRMSLGVHLLLTNLVARMPFDAVRDVLGLFMGYVPCTRSVLGMVDQIGPGARAFLDQLPAPEGDGEILVVQVDAKGAPMIREQEHRKRCRPHQKRPKGASQRGVRRLKRRESPRPRRKKGDKSKNAKMANIGVVYTLRRLEDGSLEGPINKRVLGTFGSTTALFDKLVPELEQRGYPEKETIFLADGASTLWSHQQEYFSRATPCLDWYHLTEYLWEAGTAAHKEGSDNLLTWIQQRKDELRSGDVDGLLFALHQLETDIAKSGPGTRGRRQRVAKAQRYVLNHLEQLNYDDLLPRDIDVATGAVEGAVKHLVGARLDGSGMRWVPKRAEHVLALRLVLINGMWDEFEKWMVTQHERLSHYTVPALAPKGPLETHDAQRKAA